MGLTIPNAADATYPDQAEPDSRDFDIMVAAYAGTGVIGGCAVTAQGTPDMTVAVAAGTVGVGGLQVAVAGGNVTIGAADPSVPRFDLVTVDGAGAKAAVAGTASGNATFPAIPAGRVVLAAVYVPAGATTVAAGQVVDKRVVLGPVDGSAAVPSLRTLGTGATQAAAGNDARLSDARAPTGPAGGVLGGTYPNPALAPTNLISDFDVPDVAPAPGWTSIDVPAARPQFRITSGKLASPGGGNPYAWHTPSGVAVGPNCEVWVTLGAGTYWEIGLRMDAAGATGYSLGYDSGTGRLTIMKDGGNTPIMDTAETVALAAGDSIRLRAFEGQITAWYRHPADTKWTFFRNAFDNDVTVAGRLSLYSTGGASYDAFGGGSLPLAPIDQPYHDSSRQVQVDFYDQFPTADDGYARGYFENSLWVVNYPYRVLLVNVDGTVGAAQWRPVISATIQDHAPGSNDDQSKGYGGGFMWLNYGDPDYSVYVCNDATLGNAQWAQFASVAVQQHAIRKTIADAKGDLIAATGADAVARLPVGANGRALVADSAASAGLAYVAGREVLPTHYVSGAWYGLYPPGYPESDWWQQGRMVFAPFYSYGLTIATLGIRVQAPIGEAGSVLRLGIYANNPGGNRDEPTGGLLVDAGTVAGDSGGNKPLTLASPLVVPPGLNWVSVVAQLCPTTAPGWVAISVASPVIASLGSMPNPTNGGLLQSNADDVTGALPATPTMKAVPASFRIPAVIAQAA